MMAFKVSGLGMALSLLLWYTLVEAPEFQAGGCCYQVRPCTGLQTRLASNEALNMGFTGSAHFVSNFLPKTHQKQEPLTASAALHRDSKSHRHQETVHTYVKP